MGISQKAVARILTGIGVLGLTTATVGVALIYLPAALIFLGASLLVVVLLAVTVEV